MGIKQEPSQGRAIIDHSHELIKRTKSTSDSFYKMTKTQPMIPSTKENEVT